MIQAYHAGYVVDVSVGVKWFIREREADWDVALAFRRQHIEGRTRMIVPELFLLEVPNAIKAGRKGTEDELAQVLTTLADLDIQVEQHALPVLRKTNAMAWAIISPSTMPCTSPWPRFWDSPVSPRIMPYFEK